MATKPKATKTTKTMVVPAILTDAPISPTVATAIAHVEAVTAKRNIPDLATLKRDVLDALATISKNNLDNVKRNQFIAWRIMCYRETRETNVSFETMIGSSEAQTAFKRDIRKLFISDTPKKPKHGSVDQDLKRRKLKHKADSRIINDACMFAMIVGVAGITSENYYETNKTFEVPGRLLIHAGWEPSYELHRNELVELDGAQHELKRLNAEGKREYRDVYASLAQVLRVFTTASEADADTNADADALKIVGGASEHKGYDDATIKGVLSSIGVDKLAPALAALIDGADMKGVAPKREHHEPEVFDAMLKITRYMNRLLANEKRMQDEGTKKAA